MGSTPILAHGAAAALEGKPLTAINLNAMNAALANELDPSGDLYTQSATKHHLARVLTLRALRQLVTGSTQ